MALPHGVRRTFRLLLPASLRDEVDEELRFHLEMRTRELIDRGLRPDRARREARRRFGDPRAVRAACVLIAERKDKTVRRSRRFDHLAQDLTTAARSLARRPGFTAAAVITLALGLGVNTTVFQAVEALVLRPLPFPDADRLVSVSGTVERESLELRAASYPEVRDWRAGVPSFGHLTAITGRPVGLTGSGEAERVQAAFIDPAYFDALGVEPLMGRRLREADNAPPAGLASVVVGHGLWRRRLGGEPDVLGRTLAIDGVPFEVVGVLPEGFGGVPGDQELWLPIRAGVRVLPGWDAELFEARGTRGLGVLGRLAPGASIERTQAELDAVSERLQREHPDHHADRGARVTSLREAMLDDSQRSSVLLLGAAALVWLVACVNVANLLLARMADRRRELAVRTSLGATRGRLAVQVLAESAVLSALGGAAGFALALWSRDLIASARPDALPPYLMQSAGSGSLVLFLAGSTLVTALLTGAGPLASLRRSDPARGLQQGSEGGRSRRLRFGGRRLRLGGRRLLVTAEVAVTLVVLVGAALLVQSFRAQTRIDPGFDADRVVAARIQLPERSYEDAAAVLRFAERLEERLAALPGVRRAALGSDVPLVSGYRATNTAAEERLAEDPEHEIRVYYHRVTPGFFTTAGIGLLAGRTFEPPPAGADPETVGEEVVVSRRLAEAAWPGENPLGKHLLFGDRAPYTVVGVVEPVRYRTLTPDPASPEDPDVYLPLAGNPPRRLALFARTEPGMSVPPAAFRSLITGLDPSLPLIDAAPLSDAVRTETAVARFAAGLFGLFGVLAAALALVGVYGVMAYSVVRRRREIGVRMALGAGRDRVIRQVLGDGAVLAAAGILAGLAAAWVLSRLVASALYATEPTDPLTYGLVAACLGATVLAACWIPALRAARTDPLRALESE